MRALAVTAALLLGGCAARQAAADKPDAPVSIFTERARNYAELHRKLKDKLPEIKDKSEPERIASVEKALAEAIQGARAQAKQGDILIPGVRGFIVAAVRSELRGAQNTPARMAVDQGNPRTGAEPAPVAVKVNAAYGKDAPLSTVPPSVLKKLPSLPEELEYRFVGKHLILRDTVANLIVDFLPDVAI